MKVTQKMLFQKTVLLTRLVKATKACDKAGYPYPDEVLEEYKAAHAAIMEELLDGELMKAKAKKAKSKAKKAKSKDRFCRGCGQMLGFCCSMKCAQLVTDRAVFLR